MPTRAAATNDELEYLYGQAEVPEFEPDGFAGLPAHSMRALPRPGTPFYYKITSARGSTTPKPKLCASMRTRRRLSREMKRGGVVVYSTTYRPRRKRRTKKPRR